MSNDSGTGNPVGGLDDLRATVAAGNADLYRHVALYLQVLRAVLPGRVEQACFHLATQVQFQRYVRLSDDQRRDLHRLLRERVSRCSSLLTVEQLMALARRLEQEKLQQHQRRQQELLQRLTQPGNKGTPGDNSPGRQTPKPDATAQVPTPLPPGSVRLDLATHLDVAGLHWNLGQPNAAGKQREASGAGDAPWPGSVEGHQGDVPIEDDDIDSGDNSAEIPPPDADASAGQQDEVDEAEWMAALIEGLIEAGALEQGENASEVESDGRTPLSDPATVGGSPLRQAPPDGPMAQRTDAASVPNTGGEAEPDGVLLEAGLSSAADIGMDAGSPWDQPGLPQDPLLLLRWIDGLEAALCRRLRNLSHAINVDLLRLGLSRGLLPLSLLEGALQGQIETQSCPPNLLRLQLPFGLRPGAPSLEAVAILLRPVDLEMEEPRLRTCRRRIHQHRQQVRKMAQTYRRLQRRLQAHEAERLWLQDIRASRTAEA